MFDSEFSDSNYYDRIQAIRIENRIFGNKMKSGSVQGKGWNKQMAEGGWLAGWPDGVDWLVSKQGGLVV